MNKRKAIHTDLAPAAIGTYSQAICVGDLVFISGQLPLLPNTMELDGQDIETQTRRVFVNLAAIAEAAGAVVDATAPLLMAAQPAIRPLGRDALPEIVAQCGGRRFGRGRGFMG